MSRRPPARPPELPGYTYERLLGSGGFSDVYLYEQHLPRRKVAVKVLTAEATRGRSKEQLVAEADVMAQLSTHSSIVAIYHAATAADGRPYLVMQYCPLPNLAERLKVRPLGVAEALGIGVRLAGAVETAHRAGIVHRDIKPANVLTTEYGRPALADFGIAGLTSTTVEESAGVSIPWAPPESVEGQPAAGVTGDVYSLAATIYTALAGRSPFTRPGGPNGRLDYTARIRQEPVPPVQRDDVPASLERVLARGMAKDPAHRHPSALELGRALQIVEQELRLRMTDVEVPDTSWIGTPAEGDDGAGRTVVRQVIEVDPHRRADHRAADQGTAEHRPADYQSATSEPEEDSHTVVRPVRGAAVTAAVPAGAAVTPPADSDDDQATDVRTETSGRRPRTALLVGAVATLVAAVGVVLGAGLLHEDDDEPEPGAGPTVPLPEQVEAPTGLAGERDGETVRFAWEPPPGADDVRYVWQEVGPGADPMVHPTTETEVTLTDVAGPVCVAVKAVASTGRTSAAAETCVD